jgi:Na+-transporting methylmalonyl-CoA/oxaloacetate decarboxylase gamma subunit
MENLMRSALELTVLGMGMTFLSLGALTLGMYAMTMLFRGKDKAEVLESDADLPVGDAVAAYREGEFVDDAGAGEAARRKAAAAAVAVALALSEAESDRASKQVSRPATADQDPWNAFARSLHLSRRAHYEGRRYRG